MRHISPIKITLLVPKIERFNFFNEEHPSNIIPISVTLIVLKLERSISAYEEHPMNIHPISVSLIVLQLEKFNSFNAFSTSLEVELQKYVSIFYFRDKY